MGFNFYKTVIVLSAILLEGTISNYAIAQSQVYFQGGYQINGNVKVDEGTLIFKNGVSYGVGIDIKIDKIIRAEINWSSSPSTAELRGKGGVIRSITDLQFHHLHAGLIGEMGRRDVRPYFLLSLGASLLHPTNVTYEDLWRFSIALGIGFKVNISDNVGLRFQSRLMLPMQFSRSSVWVGTGGVGVSLGAWTPFLDTDLSCGIFINI